MVDSPQLVLIEWVDSGQPIPGWQWLSDTSPGMRNEFDDSSPPPVGIRKAVFALQEGDVTLTFPEGLSADSVTDLKDYIEVFLRKLRREAGIEAAN